jgi:hypothetical protein
MSLEAVRAHAGHRSIESTRIYLHPTDDWLAAEHRRAAELIDANHTAARRRRTDIRRRRGTRGRCGGRGGPE